MSAAQIVRDFQTVADATFLSTKSRIEGGAAGLEMALAVALGMAHQARQILEAINAAPDERDDEVKVLREALQSARGWLVTCSESAQARKDLAKLDAALSPAKGGEA